MVAVSKWPSTYQILTHFKLSAHRRIPAARCRCICCLMMKLEIGLIMVLFTVSSSRPVTIWISKHLLNRHSCLCTNRVIMSSWIMELDMYLNSRMWSVSPINGFVSMAFWRTTKQSWTPSMYIIPIMLHFLVPMSPCYVATWATTNPAQWVMKCHCIRYHLCLKQMKMCAPWWMSKTSTLCRVMESAHRVQLYHQVMHQPMHRLFPQAMPHLNRPLIIHLKCRLFHPLTPPLIRPLFLPPKSQPKWTISTVLWSASTNYLDSILMNWVLSHRISSLLARHQPLWFIRDLTTIPFWNITKFGSMSRNSMDILLTFWKRTKPNYLSIAITSQYSPKPCVPLHIVKW